MKKSLIFLILIFLFILICIPFFPAEITGETITGEVPAQSLALNITVLGAPPLSILSPENETYLNNESLLLNYTVRLEDAVWYNIDLIGENITITSPIYFNTSQGGHTLYLYANNTYNTTTRNITFTVNSTRFIILYSKYNGSTKGISTDFINYSYEDIQNLSDAILENTNWGKIKFNQAINLTKDLVSTDNKLNLDSNVNLSDNKIELNSTALPNFNISATLWLYNLNFTNPRILKDGIVCSSPTCVIESYTGGTLKTLKFNVASFTIYSAEETPTSTPPAETPSGGGAKITKDFSIDKERIKISLKQGQAKKEQITIKNKGNRKANFKVLAVRLEDFIRINEAEFDLDAGKSKTINIDFIAGEESIPDLYIGKLLIESEGIEKEILTVIEIESKSALFDVNAEILTRYQRILPGEKMVAKIELYNLGGGQRVDVLLDYVIKDEENNEIIKEHETIAVETKASFIKEFYMHENLDFGKYVFYVKATYNGKVASASAFFEISKEEFTLKEKIYIGTILILIVLTGIIISLYLGLKRKVKHISKKIGISDIISKEKKRQK